MATDEIDSPVHAVGDSLLNRMVILARLSERIGRRETAGVS
jgi:hypothetical protein